MKIRGEITTTCGRQCPDDAPGAKCQHLFDLRGVVLLFYYKQLFFFVNKYGCFLSFWKTRCRESFLLTYLNTIIILIHLLLRHVLWWHFVTRKNKIIPVFIQFNYFIKTLSTKQWRVRYFQRKKAKYVVILIHAYILAIVFCYT